jgi:hypothetical protein
MLLFIDARLAAYALTNQLGANARYFHYVDLKNFLRFMVTFLSVPLQLLGGGGGGLSIVMD